VKKKIEVTSENFGDVLIQGLEEAVAVARGKIPPARVTRRKVTARHVEVAPPPRYRPKKIAAVRNSLGVSQPVFASMLNVSKSTVRAWEQGERAPEGATLRLIELAEKHPEVLTRTVAKRQRR
jgi:DNA-binding transcriptional regulator YiaG